MSARHGGSAGSPLPWTTLLAVPEDQTTVEPRRGRPRSERAHQAILTSAIELLYDEGLSAMNMDHVAERAGVSKATIYRWWSSKELLALDAFSTDWEAISPITSPDTGSLREDLRARLRTFRRLLKRRPVGRVLTGLLAQAQNDPEFAELYRERFLEPRRIATRTIFQRAIERGEIPADSDLDVALDLVYGALLHRLFHGHAPLDERFGEKIIETVVTGLERGKLNRAARKRP
jgi:AcrR family transcriptional regulator